MFSNISWYQYLIFICATALTWYAAIFYIYYRQDLLQILQAKKSFQTGDENTGHNFSLQRENPASIDPRNSPSSPDMGQVIQSFTDEVVAYLEEAAKNTVAKQDLLFSVGRIANKYSSLSGSDYKEPLNQFIKLQTENYCAMFLNEEDLDKLWRDT